MKSQQLAIVHLALSAAVLLWNLWIAGRTAQLRNVPRFPAAVSGLAGLLLLPALAVHLLSGSQVTGMAFASIAWIWPLTVALLAVQAIFATTRGGAPLALGIPIAIYDLLLAIVYGAAYLAEAGHPLTEPLTVVVAAERAAIALGTVPAALSLPWYLHVPIIAPLESARRGLSRIPRAAAAVLALAWSIMLAISIPGAIRAVRSYESLAADQLRERPDSDFSIGVKVFPTIGKVVPEASARRDLAIADSIGTQVLSIYISPRGTSESTLRALAEIVDGVRGERRIVVALDLAHSTPRGLEGRDLPGRRIGDVDGLVRDAARIARVLRPDYFVPVVAPMTVGIDSVAWSATLPASPDRSESEVDAGGSFREHAAGRGGGTAGDLAAWRRYIASAAAAVRQASPSTRIMVHVGGFTARDSALYAWAVSSSAHVDAVALTLFPGSGGALDIRRAERTADRWIASNRDAQFREHWILEAGGFPTVHGEPSQSRALWGILAWSTNHPMFRGLIAFEAGDYSTRLGLQTPSGRVRPAAAALKKAIVTLGE